jgi:murein DD-endopeptidase MepM/ murein hydrolase activator NlpD
MFKISIRKKWVIMMRMENAKNFFQNTIKFSRLTSRFSNNRYHPVQHRWKAHKELIMLPRTHNYTPSGTVIRTGYTAGNGNYVKVKHNNTYSTQYLHMSKSWFDVVNM